MLKIASLFNFEQSVSYIKVGQFVYTVIAWVPPEIVYSYFDILLWLVRDFGYLLTD